MEFKSTISHLVILYSSMPTRMNDYWNYMFKTIRFTKIVESNLGEIILLEFEAQIHEHCSNKKGSAVFSFYWSYNLIK